MPQRPYINKRIDALEQLFKDAPNQIAVLRILEDELQHRSVPRAIALRKRVADAIARHPEGGIFQVRNDEPLMEPGASIPATDYDEERVINAKPGDALDSLHNVNGNELSRLV